MDVFLHDLRYTFRTLRRDAGFSLIAILILAIGIGANTAIFSLVNALLFRPLPFPNADRLVFIENSGGVPPEPGAAGGSAANRPAAPQPGRRRRAVDAHDPGAQLRGLARAQPVVRSARRLLRVLQLPEREAHRRHRDRAAGGRHGHLRLLPDARRPAVDRPPVPPGGMPRQRSEGGADLAPPLGAPLQLGSIAGRARGDHQQRTGDRHRRDARLLRLRLGLRAGHARRHLDAVSHRREARQLGQHAVARRPAEARSERRVGTGRVERGDARLPSRTGGRHVMGTETHAAAGARQRTSPHGAAPAVRRGRHGAADRLREPVEPAARACLVASDGNRGADGARRDALAPDSPVADGESRALALRRRARPAAGGLRHPRRDAPPGLQPAAAANRRSGRHGARVHHRHRAPHRRDLRTRPRPADVIRSPRRCLETAGARRQRQRARGLGAAHAGRGGDRARVHPAGHRRPADPQLRARARREPRIPARTRRGTARGARAAESWMGRYPRTRSSTRSCAA